jgi:hypothetical protein
MSTTWSDDEKSGDGIGTLGPARQLTFQVTRRRCQIPKRANVSGKHLICLSHLVTSSERLAMGRTSASKSKALRKSMQDKQRRKQRTTALLAAAVGGAAVIQYMTPHLNKTPMYDSKLSGEDWVQELLHGHQDRFHDNLGMSKHVFRKLVQELQMYAGLNDSKHIKKEEQVAIFLRLCRTGGVTRDIRERFQRSADTISRCVVKILLRYNLHFYTYDHCVHRVFSRILDMVISNQFYSRHVKLPEKDVTPPEIRNNPKLYPFFEGCRGAVDGTHVDAFVPDDAISRYRN